MDLSSVKLYIENLRKDLNRHNYNYYVLNSPQISDIEFDKLMKELESLEQEFPEFVDPLSPTQRVGSDLTKGFEHVVHVRPMMSLSNSYSIEEVDDDYKVKYHIKHTPAIIVENVVITDYSKLSIKELKNILIQFIET